MVTPSPAKARNSGSSDNGVSVSLDALLRLHAQAAGLGLVHQKKVRSLRAGGYLSPYRGRGMEFEEVRGYQPGDDIRSMDWRVTARTGRPHTKLFREERERPVLLLVDLGASMAFGTRVAFKSVVAAQAAALLAWGARDNGDRIGGVVVGVEGHAELRPVARDRGVLRLLKAIARLQPDLATISGSPEGAPFTDALRRLVRIARPGSLLFVISDFRGLDGTAEYYFRSLAAHNDIVNVFVFDPLEAEAPPPGSYPVSDGAQVATLDMRSAEAARAYARRFAERHQRIRDLSRRHRAHFITLRTCDDPATALRRGLGAHHGAPAVAARYG